MPSIPPYGDGLVITPVGPNKYSVEVVQDWSFTIIAHGGFLASALQRAVSLYAVEVLKLDHPDTMAIHMEFLRPTMLGAVEIVVDQIKNSRTNSLYHVQVLQNGKQTVLGYITNINFAKAKGPSFDTGFELHPKPAPLDLKTFDNNTSQTHWEYTIPDRAENYAPVLRHFTWIAPNEPPHPTSINDSWLKFRNPNHRIHNGHVGFLADFALPVLSNFYEREISSLKNLRVKAEAFKRGEFPAIPADWKAEVWQPTHSMNVEVKKMLPPEGVEWVFIRARIKQCKDGRFDGEVTILDEANELVALAKLTSFALTPPQMFSKPRDLTVAPQRLEKM